MEDTNQPYRLGFESRVQNERSTFDDLAQVIADSPFTGVERAMAFQLYAPRQNLAQFLFKYELFKQIVDVHGAVVECGVLYGAGLMGFAQFSAILEPYNHTRRIVGFDTFSGFPRVHGHDVHGGHGHAKEGGMKIDSKAELERCLALYDRNRPIGHIPRVELVQGDAMASIPAYVERNPHLVVALLYLDFDIYEPTKVALQNILPRMPKGAVIAFDELYNAKWPGETVAVLEEIGMRNLRLKRVPWDSTRSYAVIE